MSATPATFSDIHLDVDFGFNVRPPASLGSGALHIGAKVSAKATSPLAWGYAARIHFGASGTITGSLSNGNFASTGARQVELANYSTWSVSAGTYNLVVTGADIVGSPLTVPVALAAGDSTEAVSAKLVAKLQSVAALSAFEFWADVPGRLWMRRKYPAANDATLNLGLPSALGVTSGGANSQNRVAGAAGIEVERLGGSAEDAFGAPLEAGSPTLVGLVIRSIRNSAVMLNCEAISLQAPWIPAGGFVAMGLTNDLMDEPCSLTSNGASTAEIYVIAQI
jgi:hypothetical protein